MRTRPILITTAGITLALTLAGCSSSNTGTAASSSPAASSPAASSPAATGGMMNGSKSPGGTMMSGSPAATGTGSAGDIAFAQLMIPHHEQAIQMADMAATNASSPQVKDLAAQIKKAQDPEIQTMSGWLDTWGAPASMPSSSGSGGSMDGMDMGGMTAGAGMMSAADMTKLDTTKGAAFDKMWLQMMITHHQGAISMAQQVASTTTDPQVKAMAEAIIKGQTAEIAAMQQMLTK